VTKLTIASLSESTWGNYLRFFKKWTDFCQEYNIDFRTHKSFSENNIIRFIARTLSVRLLQFKTVEGMLEGIKGVYNCFGGAPGWRSHRLKTLLKGLQKLQPANPDRGAIIPS
jgi:hypothetical protein